MVRSAGARGAARGSAAPRPLPLRACTSCWARSTRRASLRARARSAAADTYARLAEAHRLAIDTHMPARDIALATGFSSPASFARAFRAAYATSTRALRKSRTTP